MEEYTYPLRDFWSTSEIIQAIEFYGLIESANEKGVNRENLLNKYREFQTIAGSKSEEKQIDKEFERVSGYSIYKTINEAKRTASGNVVKI